MEDIGEFLVPYLPEVNLARSCDRIYKDECCFGFDTPFSEGGLYVCMRTFKSFGREFVEKYHAETGNRVFLKLKKIVLEKMPSSDDEPKVAPTKLAIGVEGGFKDDTVTDEEYIEENTIVILPSFIEIPIDKIEEIPFHMLNCIDSILKTDSAAIKDIISWDGEERKISRHSENLKQLDSVKLPPSGWKCTNCDLTTNLWANLTDGTILCGRKHFDGSGGNDHALEHYRKTGYPLAVKLGTISPGGADVYSYDEDDMVIDSKLAEHLAHFGINMMNMEKSDKTMTELQIDINQKLGSEWSILQESGKKLEPVYGPYLTGLKNMGNTCYLNTIAQVLCNVEGISQAYLSIRENIFKGAIDDPASDFNVQITKLFWGLSSGLFSSPPTSNKGKDCGITPSMFKQLVGKNHSEFSSNRQQDAQEYLLHLLSLMEKHGKKLSINPPKAFKFAIEERVECMQSKMVRYSTKAEYMMDLSIPLEAATNTEDLKIYEAGLLENNNQTKFTEKPRLNVPFSACVESFFSPVVVEDFWSSALKEKSTALKSSKFASFPNFLIVQLKKFTLGDDWVPKKLDVSVDVPDFLDLEQFRAKGLQEGEVCLPEDEEPPKINVNEEMVAQLQSFGFPREACVKATHHVGNGGIEAAMNWLIDHAGDSDFAAPVTNPSEPANVIDIKDDNITMVMSMGFTRQQALTALKATSDNVERAVDWIFTHMDELNSIADVQGDSEASSSKLPGDRGQNVYEDGCGKYDLFAFISHMGTSTLCGHYVCHIKRDGKWIIFNDEKVAVSEDPPKTLGYLYFYKRRVQSS